MLELIIFSSVLHKFVSSSFLDFFKKIFFENLKKKDLPRVQVLIFHLLDARQLLFVMLLFYLIFHLFRYLGIIILLKNRKLKIILKIT